VSPASGAYEVMTPTPEENCPPDTEMVMTDPETDTTVAVRIPLGIPAVFWVWAASLVVTRSPGRTRAG
jgi:hypothetical protein